jgi:hypothetical protein
MKRHCPLARAAFVVFGLMVAACGSATPSGAPGSSASPEVSPSSQPSPSSAATTGSPLVSSCLPDLVGPGRPVTHAFEAMTIPAGADACQGVGSLGNPQPLHLTNDGPLVAYNARDFEHETSLWLGDLRDGSIEVAYVAAEDPAHKVELLWPQLAAGQLFWIEYVHQGPNVQTPVIDWTVKGMDVSTRAVTLVASGRMPDLGGKAYPERIRWDGHALAVMEGLAKDKWQIELWDEAGKVQQAIPVSGTPWGLALVDGGLLFTAGTPNPEQYAVGDMRLYRWTPTGGTRQVGADVYDVAGCSDLAAWISDPAASQESIPMPVTERVYVARAPFEESTPLSPIPSEETRVPGADAVACDSETVAWWEVEGGDELGSERTLGIDVLTVWQPGWQTPLQIETSGSGMYLSAGGGWIVWLEYSLSGTYGRLRGVPVSALAGGRE